MDPQLFCLRWNNHQTNLLSVFDQLLQVEAFCDVTLAVDGASIKCHKMVLAACSNYFQSLFMENTCKHPIVFLKDIRFNQIRALLDYMYHGEVSVEEAELPALLKIAEALKVKGLVESEEERQGGSAKATPVKGNGSKQQTSSSSNESSSRPHSSNSSQSIWPVATMKLLSPASKNSSAPREPTEEDPGHLVIDEDGMSTDGQAPMTMSPLDVDYDMNYLNEDTPPAPGMVKTIGANGKVEWKRYKQYTKDDILAAIEEVKNGMSALQASRKYGVPSRTLYDKVKKMGILTANMQKQLQQKKGTEMEQKGVSGNGLSPNYPPINLLGLQLPQSSLPTPDKDGKAPVPPFSGAMMMNMIERMKLVAGAGGLKHLPPTSTPLNLSAMLDASSEDGGGGTGGGDGVDAEAASTGGESRTSKEQADNKTETTAGGESDIRAQFFAQLASSLTEKDNKASPATSVSASVIRPLNGDVKSESKSVTLAPREETPTSPSSPTAVLPPRKRKYSADESDHHLQAEETNSHCLKVEEEREALEAGTC